MPRTRTTRHLIDSNFRSLQTLAHQRLAGRTTRLKRIQFLMRCLTAEIRSSLNQPRLVIRRLQLSTVTGTPRFRPPRARNSEAATATSSNQINGQYSVTPTLVRRRIRARPLASFTVASGAVCSDYHLFGPGINPRFLMKMLRTLGRELSGQGFLSGLKKKERQVCT